MIVRSSLSPSPSTLPFEIPSKRPLEMPLEILPPNCPRLESPLESALESVPNTGLESRPGTGEPGHVCMQVEQFLLSCRTLHLGIEHAMVRFLGSKGAEMCAHVSLG